MADPLSILGAAVGVTSLTIQLADECVKGYKLYREATNFPREHHYLLVRLQIEQQRFLNFAAEAGVLHTHGIICGTLQINRMLLMAILAEVKALFETYAIANGRYETISGAAKIDWEDHIEPGKDLMGLAHIAVSDDGHSKKANPADRRADFADRFRGLKKTAAQSLKNWRTIAVEPKRLVWATVDKDTFENMISKLESLNSFLITLLDSSQLRRLQDSMTTTYREILQLRNDFVDLTALVKALSPANEAQGTVLPEAVLLNSALSQAIAQEQAEQKRIKDYLRRLTEVKMQLSSLNRPEQTITKDESDSIVFQPPLDDVNFDEKQLLLEEQPKRTKAVHDGKAVWIEWKDVKLGNFTSLNDVQAQRRISLLTALLRSDKPEGFRAAPCRGYIQTTDKEEFTHFGIVFEGSPTPPVTLRELLGSRPLPPLSIRISLCAKLARCIHSLHAVDWLHKALRSDNIVFDSTSELADLEEPFVSGFELSRPRMMDEWTESPDFDPAEDIYRHPNAQAGRKEGNYDKSYDIYSLGVVMTEIALWEAIEDVVGLANLPEAKPPALKKVRVQLLEQPGKNSADGAETCLQRVASACGNSLRDVIECCLTLGSESSTQSSRANRLHQEILETDLTKRLEELAAIV